MFLLHNASFAENRGADATCAAVSLVLGTAYPIYSSIALLESNAPKEVKEQQAAQWLTYWAVYGVISAAEQMVESRPPLYYHVKLALLFWLQNSKYQVSSASSQTPCRIYLP